MNIFENATKQKLRFNTDKGLLTVEQLWDLSLTNLDSVARGVNSELKSLTEESFVEIKPDVRKTILELQLELLKHIIAVKLEEKDKAAKTKERAEKRKLLLDALASKENEELNSMSKEDILKQLENL